MEKRKIMTIIEITYFLFSFAMLFLIGNYYYTMAHENVHKQILRSHGINGSISIYNFGFTGVTTYEEGSCNEQCQFDNRLVENIGYHFSAVIVNLWLIFGAFITYKVVTYR